jgi:polysaccharide export outer membrane protein
MKLNHSLQPSLRISGLCLLVTLCSGCVSTPPVSDLPPAPHEAPPLKPAAHLPPYQLQIGDVLAIKLMLNPELNDEVTVQPDGMISTSVAQDILAYGRTPHELRDDLAESYKSQLKNPRLTVVVRSFAPNRVYVLGEVNAPGEFITIGPNLTLLQAVARAGGLKNSARPDEIVILRHGAGEGSEAFAADYKAAVSGADPESDVRLAPYDVVYVPRSGVADIYLYFQQYLQQFVPDSFGLSYQVNPSTSVTTP